MSIQEMKDLKQQYLDEMKRLINSEYPDEIKIDELKGNFNSMSIEINKKEKLLQVEQLANLSTYPSKRFNSFCYDDDDDDEDYTIAVTPSLSNEEPDNSLKISSGSTTTHSDSSLYDSFIFDLSTSYLHQSMIVSSSRLNPTRGISPWMWWRIFLQQKNQEFIMLCPPFN
nr:hypothetical protein [Tanacetum cinerariifolium]